MYSTSTRPSSSRSKRSESTAHESMGIFRNHLHWSPPIRGAEALERRKLMVFNKHDYQYRLETLKQRALSRLAKLASPLTAGDGLKCPPRLMHGIWYCSHCTYENKLIAIEGPHPFGYLICEHCQRIWTPRSPTTRALTHLVARNMDPVRVPDYAGSAVPYGSVCGSCGLTHRATPAKGPRDRREGTHIRFITPCICGASYDSQIPRFKIEDDELCFGYTCDPDMCAWGHQMGNILNLRPENKRSLS